MAKRRANGEGNIRKRSDGRWEGRYTAGYDPTTGKRIIKNVLGKTQAEVKAKLAKVLEEIKDLDMIRAEEYTVTTWLRTWYDLYAKPNIRLATADRYKLMIETYTIPPDRQDQTHQINLPRSPETLQRPDGEWPGPRWEESESWPEQYHRPQRPPHAPLRLRASRQRAANLP